MLLPAPLVARLHRKADAARWRVPVEGFSAALEAAVAKAFPGGHPSAKDIERFLEALQLADVALACACAAGDDEAWEHFVREYRPALYRAADALDGTGNARELADGLYADLFGMKERDGERRSLFRYFHGRSSLATWLRAILSQRHVDRIRATRRTESLPDDESASALPAADRPLDPHRARVTEFLRGTLARVMATLVPRDRLRLSCYYAQSLTLAQIGRLLGEHEATVSRHLTRTRRDIRQRVEQHLREVARFSPADIDECFAAVTEDPGALDVSELLGTGVVRKDVAVDRSRS
ncbi:MAG: sigma-70 family RNA polymerase sigma factor [Acidobacteriota bacterium]